MIRKILQPVYKELKRVSPSQYFAMKLCSYKIVLAESYDKKPLLPVSSNAYFGTALHSMFEKIAKGLITEDDQFAEHFLLEISSVEKRLVDQGFDFFVPLQQNVKDFGLKKLLLKKHVRRNTERTSTSYNSVKFSGERWIQTRNGKIGGIVDLIIESESGVELVDFKSGAVTSEILDDSEEVIYQIKPEYSEQLKLYAFAYFETFGRYPTKLSLCDLYKQKHGIEFTPEECEALTIEAGNFLDSINEGVKKNQFVAYPSEVNCRYCLYRPGCRFYSHYLETNAPMNDVAGVLQDVVFYQNGNLTATLTTPLGLYSIIKLTGIRFNNLAEYKGKRIVCYNLKKTAVPMAYAAAKTTIIYEY